MTQKERRHAIRETKQEAKRRRLRVEKAAPALLAACEDADKALNICARYFLGTGPQPEPEELAPVAIKLREVIAEAKGE